MPGIPAHPDSLAPLPVVFFLGEIQEKSRPGTCTQCVFTASLAQGDGHLHVSWGTARDEVISSFPLSCAIPARLQHSELQGVWRWPLHPSWWRIPMGSIRGCLQHFPVSKMRANTVICQHRPALPVGKEMWGSRTRIFPVLRFPPSPLADHFVLPRTELGRHHSIFLQPFSVGDRNWGCPGDTEGTGTQEFASPVTLRLQLLKQSLCGEVGILWDTGEGTWGLPRVSGCASPYSCCLYSPSLPACPSVTAVPRSMTPSPRSPSGCSPSSAAPTVSSQSPMGCPPSPPVVPSANADSRRMTQLVCPRMPLPVPGGLFRVRAGPHRGVPAFQGHAGCSPSSPLPPPCFPSVPAPLGQCPAAPVPVPRSPLAAPRPARPRGQRPEPPVLAE